MMLRQEYITERSYSFIADYGTTETLIVDVDPIDIQTIDVFAICLIRRLRSKEHYHVTRNNALMIFPYTYCMIKTFIHIG